MVHVVDHRAPDIRLIEILRSGDREALSRLLHDAPMQILPLLCSKEVLAHAPHTDLRWLAEVYADTLAKTGDITESEEAVGTDDPEDAAIGKAFADTLLRDLPEAAFDFKGVFREAPLAAQELVNNVRQHASVKHGGPIAVVLAEYGLTPSSILDASVAVSRAVRRYYREHNLDPDKSIFLTKTVPTGASNLVIPQEDMVDEIAWTLGVSKKIAESLLGWMITISEQRNYFFEGFIIEMEPAGVSARPLGVQRRQDLKFLWGGARAAIPVA